MLYTVTDYNAGEYGTDLLQKLAFCRSDAQNQKIHNALADYPEELIVYRGEAEGSTNYRKAISWSLDINTAFFFACRHGDQNHARIIRAKIRRKDVFALNLDSREKEVLAIPGTPYDVTTERLIGPDSPLVMPFRYLDEYRKGVEQILRLYKLHQKVERITASSTPHGLFLALTIIQAGKIRRAERNCRSSPTPLFSMTLAGKMIVWTMATGKPAGKSMKKMQAAPQICRLLSHRISLP